MALKLGNSQQSASLFLKLSLLVADLDDIVLNFLLYVFLGQKHSTVSDKKSLKRC